jgi:hypothetical protein
LNIKLKILAALVKATRSIRTYSRLQRQKELLPQVSTNYPQLIVEIMAMMSKKAICLRYSSSRL